MTGLEGTRRLPRSDWAARDDLPSLIATLGADDCRYVGGCVRDALLGLSAADVDVATRLRPEIVMERLRAAGIRAIPTGIDHGTVTAVLPGGPVEITTLRRDVATDGRRATVAFAEEWRDDAARRDFTINAIYAHPETLELDDYFGGLADLDQRHVRFIGDAHQRIREDHLRILRYFRFQARFGGQPPDEQAVAACQELSATLKGLSRERVAGELLAILSLPDPTPTVRSMMELGVLPVVLPETDAAEIETLARLVTAERSAGIEPDGVRRLSALLPAERAIAEQVAARLRLSNAQKRRIGHAADRTSEAEELRALAYALGQEAALDRALLIGMPIDPLIGWTIPQLPVKGGDIVRAGVSAGPLVAATLRRVEQRWIAEGFPAEDRARQILDEEVARLES